MVSLRCDVLFFQSDTLLEIMWTFRSQRSNVVINETTETKRYGP